MQTELENAMVLERSAIRSVTAYQTAVATSCDRCAAGIKNVFVVRYQDGETQKYGSECIHKILNGEPTLRKLFDKNVKLLKRYQEALEVLSGPVEQMPRGREYFNSGKYFIANAKGEDIFFGSHWFFHPLYDAEKNAAGRNYIERDPESYARRMLAEIEADKPKLAAEIARLEAFLGKVLRAVKK